MARQVGEELESVSKQHGFARGGYYGAYFMAPYRYDIRSLSLCNKCVRRLTIKSEDGKGRIGKCNTGVLRRERE